LVMSLENGLAPPDEIPPELTPLTGSKAARALRHAWTSALRQTPSKDVVLVLTAHWAHETHGGRLMYNFNFGGIKGHAPDGLSCIREAHEGSGYHVRALTDRFRAYRNAEDGADDYLSLLIRKDPAAIDAVERGDVTDFVSALKRGGYFTGSETAYARSLSDLVQRAFEQGFDALSRPPPGG
jgi:flagellum-specific peptidoglycan hydrolase FlgJ